jgi:aspartate kinase
MKSGEMTRTALPRAGTERRARTAPVVVMNFGGIPLEDTHAIARVAATIVEKHVQGANVVALLPPYGAAAPGLDELAAAVSPDPVPRELDLLTSVGASMAVALCAMAVHRRGCRAVSLDGAEAGILTDGAHTHARIVEIRTGRILTELGRHGVVVLPGTSGVTRESHEITTLSAAGAAFAAATLARTLGAELVVPVQQVGDDA